MLRTFITSYRLRITYRANSIIFALRQLPLIKKLIPETLYASTGLKKLASVLAFLYEIISAFVGKLIYVLGMIYLIPSLYADVSNSSYVILTFFCLTVMGAFVNTGLFHATKDKYYAIFLMRMNASECLRTEYIYFLLNRLISFYPAVLLLRLMTGVSLTVCLLMPVFMVSVKLIWSGLQLVLFRKKGKLYNEDTMPLAGWVAMLALAAAAYGLPAIGIGMTEPVFIGIALICVVVAIPACIEMIRFQKYKEICRLLLCGSPIIMATKEATREITQNNYRKKIEMTDEVIDSKKTGYAYFHEIFVGRHRKLLQKPSKIMTIVLVAAMLALVVATLFSKVLRESVHTILTNYYTYSILLLYFTNRGGVATETMFRNCDQSMLSFSFYRKPKAVLALFRERLKTLIQLNLLPATPLAIGFPLLLYVSGGTETPLEYLVILISVYGMAVFFSVHTLVMYYLLQPYNKEIENKSIAFFVVNMVTYVLCFGIAGEQIPTLLFGAVVIGFCVVYISLALLLVYRFAPKTFRLR